MENLPNITTANNTKIKTVKIYGKTKTSANANLKKESPDSSPKDAENFRK
jgi:hypothetical protein